MSDQDHRVFVKFTEIDGVALTVEEFEALKKYLSTTGVPHPAKQYFPQIRALDKVLVAAKRFDNLVGRVQ